MRVRHVALVAGLLCLVVTGCTTASQGEPVPGDITENSTMTSAAPSSGGVDDLPSNGAPKVDNPLDTTRFQQNPCLTLTAKQAQDDLKLPPQGEPAEAPLGNSCKWLNPDTRGAVHIDFLPGNPRGLSSAYAANQRGEYPYFEVLQPIEGYPAIASDIEDRRPRGICIVVVGVSDKLTFDVYLQLSQANVGKIKPCEKATEVAGMALRTMKAGA